MIDIGIHMVDTRVYIAMQLTSHEIMRVIILSNIIVERE